MTHETAPMATPTMEGAVERPNVIHFNVGELTKFDMLKLAEVADDVAQRVNANFPPIVTAMTVDAVEAVQATQDPTVQEMIAENLMNGIDGQMLYQDPDERVAVMAEVLYQLRTIGDDRMRSKEQQALAAEKEKVAALEAKIAEIKDGRQAVMQDLLRVFEEGDQRRVLVLMANLQLARLDSPIDFTQPARGVRAYANVSEDSTPEVTERTPEVPETVRHDTKLRRLRSYIGSKILSSPTFSRA